MGKQISKSHLRCSGGSPGSNPNDIENDLEAFAKRFSRCRIKLGVSQDRVNDDLRAAYGDSIVSQITISRFERWRVSKPTPITLKRMKELRPLLQKWLEQEEKPDEELELSRKHSLPNKIGTSCFPGIFFFFFNRPIFYFHFVYRWIFSFQEEEELLKKSYCRIIIQIM